MSYSTAKAALRELRQLARSSPTPRQLQIAAAIGCRLQRRTPMVVAAVKLQIALSEDLLLRPVNDPSEQTLAYLSEIAGRVAMPEPTSQEEAEAWIMYMRYSTRKNALERLQLSSGDLVRRTTIAQDVLHEVSSISGDGTVWLRGAGNRSWPDQLEVEIRASETGDSAELKRKQARDGAPVRRQMEWSQSMVNRMSEFEVHGTVSETDIELLSDVIDSAVDERPIQKFLEGRPQILGSLIAGHHRYVRKQVSLGGRYYPDFMMAYVNSLGPTWYYVELETPQSSVVLKTKRDYEKHAREGIAQVKEWRTWVEANGNAAQRSREADGYDLPGLRSNADGIVLVGRRNLLNPRHDDLRRQTWEDSRIQVHTYDWLLDRLKGIAAEFGAPALNRDRLSSQRDPFESDVSF